MITWCALPVSKLDDGTFVEEVHNLDHISVTVAVQACAGRENEFVALTNLHAVQQHSLRLFLRTGWGEKERKKSRHLFGLGRYGRWGQQTKCFKLKNPSPLGKTEWQMPYLRSSGMNSKMSSGIFRMYLAGNSRGQKFSPMQDSVLLKTTEHIGVPAIEKRDFVIWFLIFILPLIWPESKHRPLF